MSYVDYINYAGYRVQIPLDKLRKDLLPDITPQYIDNSIKEFKSKLCCRVHSIAIINSHRVCEDCFNSLKEKYTGEHWNLRG